MNVETIHVRIEDEAERRQFLAVWYLTAALRAVGAGDQVIPALQELLDRAAAAGRRGRGPAWLGTVASER